MIKVTKRTRNIIFISAGVLLVVGIVEAILNKKKQDAWEAELMDKVNKGVGATGTSADVQSSDAFDSNYWQTVSDSSLPSANAADNYANDINGLLTAYWIDDNALVAYFATNFHSKAEISRVADEYMKRYGQNLGQFLATTLGGISLTGKNAAALQQINTFINNLPNTI